jgi:threonine aldolase
MFFASDNAGPVHPQILQALSAANEGYALPYGADPIMEEVRAQIREIFEAPGAAVYLVPTGTAANSLALATMSQPWETVFCSPVAHIHEDECNAPEFYMGGAKLTLVGQGDKMRPEALRTAITNEETRGVHGPQRGPVSITQVTERGSVYSLDELKALCDVAKEFGLKTHMDGARFANALVALRCTPAEMSWKLGIDAISFGATKNGAMGVEAVIFICSLNIAIFLRKCRDIWPMGSGLKMRAAPMQAPPFCATGWLNGALRSSKGARPILSSPPSPAPCINVCIGRGRNIICGQES